MRNSSSTLALNSICECLGLDHGGVISIVGAGGKTSLMFRLACEMSRTKSTVLTTTTAKMLFPSKDQSPHTILAASPHDVIHQADELLRSKFHLSAAASRSPEQPEKLIGFPPEAIDLLESSGRFQWIIVEADGAAQRPLKAPAAHEPVIPQTSRWIIAVVGLAAIGQPLEPHWIFRHERYAAITGTRPGRPVTESSVVKAAAHADGFFRGSPSNARKILFLNTAGNRSKVSTGRKVLDALKIEKDGAGVHCVIIGCPRERRPVIECDQFSALS